MNKKTALIIPIAGRSRRFQEKGYKTHKAFLPIGKKVIIEEIISLFPQNIYQPIIVCTKKQLKENESLMKELVISFRDLEIQTIEEHELGPTYSIAQVNIESNRPVVIHYCDFIVKSCFKQLNDIINGGLICAPYFKGFHPASLGTTKFAYMKLSSHKRLITLKEKESFTDNRIEEPCSTGIYGFPSFGVLKEISQKLLSSPGEWGHPECYTSLCLNKAIEMGYEVYCNEVEKFICLGTPRDYEEYNYWLDIYSKYEENKLIKSQITDSHIITAAGKGSRFKKEEYRLPKIAIKFDGKALLQHSIDSLRSTRNTLILLKDNENIIKTIDSRTINTFYLKKTPNGQLLSLYEYLKTYKGKEQFYVSSADYSFGYSKKKVDDIILQNDPDVIIFTTPWNTYAFNTPKHYGFVNKADNSEVIEIVEKPDFIPNKSLLDSLLIGTFWFKSPKIIEELISISSEDEEQEEAFIAKTISKKLSSLSVFSIQVDFWLSLGTPKELNLGEYWFDYFKHK